VELISDMLLEKH